VVGEQVLAGPVRKVGLDVLKEAVGECRPGQGGVFEVAGDSEALLRPAWNDVDGAVPGRRGAILDLARAAD